MLAFARGQARAKLVHFPLIDVEAGAFDQRRILVERGRDIRHWLVQLDLGTGERTIWRSLTPPDPTGIYRIGRVSTSADGTAYGYNYYMQLVDLHVVSGLK